MKASDAPVSSCWQAKAGETWARLQEQTDAELQPLGQLALDRLQIRPSERVLDVGCGAGQTVLQLAELVGPEGHVTGVDIAEPLLQRARERVAQAQFKQVDLVLADAASAKFAAAFDVCFSRFGVMFFEDSSAAFRNLRGALRPGGRLGFACWQALSKNAWANMLLDTVLAIVPDHPLPDMLVPNRPGPFRFADPAELEQILTAAGFSDVKIEPNEPWVRFGGPTLDKSVDYCLEIGPAARVIADTDPALRPRFRAALETALAPHMTAEGAQLKGAIYVVTARN